MARPDDSRIIADAASLLRDDEEADSKPVEGVEPVGSPEVSEAVDSYDLAGTAEAPASPRPAPPEPSEAPASPRAPAPSKAPTPSKAPEATEAPDVPTRPERERVKPTADESLEASTVDPTWSRAAEWGPALIRITIALVATIGLFWIFLSVGSTSMAFLGLLVGTIVCGLLSYPIAITLDRPVRMTPEHALTDFYEAMSHHLPQHRRMWLLLSDDGRRSKRFRSYKAFRAYHRRRLAEIRGSGNRWTPVKAKIDQVQADKSAGKDVVSASYHLTITLRGKPDASPLYSKELRTTLSRGPDRMWYLDDGTLPPA